MQVFVEDKITFFTYVLFFPFRFVVRCLPSSFLRSTDRIYPRVRRLKQEKLHQSVSQQQQPKPLLLLLLLRVRVLPLQRPPPRTLVLWMFRNFRERFLIFRFRRCL